MMRRRGFLKGLFGAALVPIVGKGDGVSLMSIPHPHLNERNIENACADMSNGFGLAPLKREGDIVAYDAEDGRFMVRKDGQLMRSDDGVTWTSGDGVG